MAEHTAELNAVIARWLGWIKHDYDCKWSPWEDPADHRMHSDPPAYAGDLNAWGDVWPAIERCGYEDHFGVELMKVQLNEPPCRTGYYECAKATARQRAEALVRVIGGGE